MPPDREHRSGLPGWRRTAVALGLSLLGSCQSTCCFGDVCDWSDAAQGPENLATVRIVPEEVWAAPNASFQLQLEGRDAQGRPVPVPAAGVSWSGASGVTATGSGGVGSVSVSPLASTSPVTVTATVAGLTATARVYIATAGDGDRIRLPGNAGLPPSVVVLDANEATCQEDLLYTVAVEAALGRNLTPGCDPPEVAIFSPELGAQVELAAFAAPNVPPWTTSEDVLTRSLPALRKVPVHLRMHVTPSLTTEAEIEIEDVASAIFSQAGAGISFTVDDVVEGGADLTFATASCADTVLLRTKYSVDLMQRRLYVAYVDKLTPEYRGFACERRSSHQGAVVFVTPGRSVTTAAHELGHAMGLNNPLPWWGHTGTFIGTLHGFDVTNLMWTGTDTESPFARYSISTGQAYRMNADAASWLVFSHGLAPKSCPCDPYDDMVCPAVYLAPGVPGPPPGSSPACTLPPP